MGYDPNMTSIFSELFGAVRRELGSDGFVSPAIVRWAALRISLLEIIDFADGELFPYGER